MTRFVHVTVLVMVVVLGAASGVARAQEGEPGGLPGGSTIMFSELKIHENNSEELVFPIKDPESKWHYFNLAHCQCAAPGISKKTDYREDKFSYLLTIVNPTMMSIPETVDLWVGPECSDDETNDKNCTPLGSTGSVNEIRDKMGARPEINVFDLMAPTPKTPRTVADCATSGSASSTGTLWLLFDNNAGGQPEYFTSQMISIDRGPPAMPTNITARGGESAIQLSWTPPTDTADTYAYQALCSKASDNSPGRATGRPAPLYDTAAGLCEATAAETAIELTAVDIAAPASGPDAGVASLEGGLKDLDTTFLCGQDTNPTSTGMRISGLQNNVAYNVVLLAMDKFGNARGRYFTSTITPVPSIDFWEDLDNRDRNLEGGLCLLAETYGDDSSLTSMLRAFRDDTLGGSSAGRWLGDAYYATLGRLGGLVHGSLAARVVAGVLLAPLVVVALLWHGLTLPGLLALVALTWLWRRRRIAMPRWLLRSAAPAGAATLVLTLASLPAHAGGYQPYWQNSNIGDEQEQSLADEVGMVKWLVGIRVGPYVPDIDARFKDSPGPYKQMFGGYHMLVALDVDRVLWASPFGQVSVGLSLGYMQKRARAFAMDSEGSAEDRARATDENKFRLIPTALTASYHFTMLDDDYGIPVVPYVRAGLSYYLWWISDANGIATVCKDGSSKDANPMCSKDKALGASLGLQGSIGLSIRAERIDASTATSMRQSGIQHAGIYGELSLAKVDGFGSDSKLSLGDRTWFAGVNFEF